MKLLSAMLVLLCVGCVNLTPQAIDASNLVGEYWNGDGFWPRSLDLRDDGSFIYDQMTDTMRMIDDEHFEFEGSWHLSGHWTFVPPDRIDMIRDGKPERISVFVRRSKKAGFAILEPDMFSDILSTWSDDGSLRYLKRKKKNPNQSPEPTAMSVTPPAAQEPRQP
jgi:hypothetical protein